MERRKFLKATGATAAALSLAGCSGVPGIGGPGEQLRDEDESVQSFRESHRTALAETGSFTADLAITRSRGGPSSTNVYSFAVDESSDQARAAYERGGKILKMYTVEDTTYVQRKDSADVAAEDAEYQTDSKPYESQEVQPVKTKDAALAEGIFPFDVPHYKTETKTRDGVDVTVYEAKEEDGIKEIESKAAEGSDASVDSFSSKLVVDSAGIVRYQLVSYSVSAGGKTMTGEMELEVSNVGETSVEEPSWLAVAEEQTQSE